MPLARRVLAGELGIGDRITVEVVDDRLTFKRLSPEGEETPVAAVAEVSQQVA